MAAIFIIGSMAFAQEIKLKSGYIIKGQLIKKTKSYIVVDQGLGEPVTYYMDVDKQLGVEPNENLPKGEPVVEKLIEPESIKPEVKVPVQAPRIPLPEIIDESWNPNISENELKKSIEVYVLALNSGDAQWLSQFIGEDAKFFSLEENTAYKYTGQDYLNILKATWSKGESPQFKISVDLFKLEGPQAITEETVTKSSDASRSNTYRQKNIYAKIDGRVKLISSELIMD